MSLYTLQLTEMLRESNAIEGVYDLNSLGMAMQAINHLLQYEALTLDNIREAHRILMENQPIEERDKGNLRTIHVTVGGRLTPAPHMVRPMLEEWIDQANTLQLPKTMHIEFERIHPFVDGNGRMGRILMNWQLIKLGQPIMVIKEAEKAEYYNWFN